MEINVLCNAVRYVISHLCESDPGGFWRRKWALGTEGRDAVIFSTDLGDEAFFCD